MSGKQARGAQSFSYATSAMALSSNRAGAARALLAVVQQVYVEDVPTRRAEDLAPGPRLREHLQELDLPHLPGARRRRRVVPREAVGRRTVSLPVAGR